jgi:dTDP-glucose 4,6-dehydratase
MTTLLITGGAGFMGSSFARLIRERYPDYRILILDQLTYAGSIDNLPVPPQAGGEHFEFWYGDVKNAALVDSLMERVTIVVHFAAETHVTRSIYDNRQFFETDVLGTQVLANAALRFSNVQRFVHISSSEVYGTAQSPAMAEEHPLLPLSPYASAKAGADRLVYSYWATYGLPAVIVRPFNNFGPRQHLEKMIPRFVTSCLLGEPMRIHGDGSAQRDWTHVLDTCEALDRVIHAERSGVVGEVFNVGSGRSLSVRQVAEMVAARMGPETCPMTFIGDRPGQVFRHTADATKAARVLGWRPQLPFEEGLDRAIAWYRENRAWWTKQLWMREVPIVTKNGTWERH